MRGSLKQATNKTGGLIRDVWKITIDTGAPIAGKRQRKFLTIHGNKKAAEARLNEELSQHDKLRRSSPGNKTVSELLTEWLSNKTKLSIRSKDSYETTLNTHLIPALGSIKLKDISDKHIEDYYRRAQENLTARSVHHQHSVLFQALKYGVKKKYLGMNPADLVEAPSSKGAEMRWLKDYEMEHLLKAAETDTYYPIIYTALNTGMRLAELLALRWKDVDLYLVQIHVERSLLKRKGVTSFPPPKSAYSKRTFGITPSLALYLGKYLEAQTDLFNTLGKRLSKDDLLFNTEGGALDPSTVSHAFKRLAQRSGFEGIHFHCLRHTFATLSLERGASPLFVSLCLGHSNVAFTLKVYGHVTKKMADHSLALLDGIMPAGVVINVIK
jgi:integrase